MHYHFGDAHEVALSLKYNFGSLKEPNYKNRDIDENLDRIRRFVKHPVK